MSEKPGRPGSYHGVYGLQAIDCPHCGENLGYQDNRDTINWDMWQHYCVAQVADMWGVDAEKVEQLHAVMKRAIAGAYPDITGTVGDPNDQPKIDMRARIAANYVLRALALNNYKMGVNDGQP